MKFSRLLNFSLSIFAGFLFSITAWADPNGNTEKWQPQWTNTFKECFEQFGTKLKTVQPPDTDDYCGGSIKPSDYKYWLSIFIPLAGKESQYSPTASGTNGKKTPQGLFQMDEADMKSHSCEGTPKNAENNICCAVKIANDLAQKYDAISSKAPQFRSQAPGIMSGFWQPMRDGMGGDGKGNNSAVNNTEKHNDIKTESKELCTSKQSELEGGTGGAGGGTPEGGSGVRR